MMIRNLENLKQNIDKTAFISDTSVILGEIKIGKNSSVWSNAVLRGDIERIEIGNFSNIQDGVVLHTSLGLPVIIGNNVTVGHGAILHGCEIADNCLIGMGAIILDGTYIASEVIIAAGALVPEDKKINQSGVYMGIPTKKIRDLNKEEQDLIDRRSIDYVELAKLYKAI